MSDPKYRVVWAEAAVRDLEEIILFVASNSPLEAEGLLSKLRQAAQSLVRSPLRGRHESAGDPSRGGCAVLVVVYTREYTLPKARTALTMILDRLPNLRLDLAEPLPS